VVFPELAFALVGPAHQNAKRIIAVPGGPLAVAMVRSR